MSDWLLFWWVLAGFVLGLLLEPLALWLAGKREPACAACGHPEPGSRFSALLRVFGPASARCQQCGSHSILTLALLAPATALAFGLLGSGEPWLPSGLLLSLYGAVLLLVAALDLRHRLVYGALTYPATLAAIVLTPWALQQPLWSGLLGSAVGALLTGCVYLLGRRLYRGSEPLGLGDVMIGGLIGAMLGFPLGLSGLFLGVLLGGAQSALLLVLGRGRSAHFAYGPALCAGALITLLGAASP